ncbi:type II toxin-antitoxin system YafQ family toxin [Helicobacter sp. 10-6591]|uniref:type II toxin-antitoxin system YafQ family toxin n=1 Tax=Helicobacter sp. 10-6591 TaxID=2004998 RepID=UPI000DCF5486|nr:type II toxin-antitoxin system YafQ family toxin [Helicobacter sp. 10-6591]RAX55620.1 type II toxin-antitoxin system mRNA interferase toxin, RelE/StbE family [Helicobacter sp. 10-6591]
MYGFRPSSRFKTQFKKLSNVDKALTRDVIERLLSGENLEPKHNDHALKGEFKDFRECHIKPDLLLIYQKDERVLVLVCIAIGSHSSLFG